MLEIVKDGVDLFVLNDANEKYHIFDDFSGYAWNLFLTCGDIGNFEHTEYRYVLNEMYVSKKKISDFMELLETYRDVRIWTSKNDTEAYLIFLYVMSLLKDKECDIRVVYTDHCLASYAFHEIGLLLLNEEKLSLEEVRRYAIEWDEIQKINSPLRILCKGEIKNITWDYFDDIILCTLRRLGKIEIGKLLGELMVQYSDDEHGYVGDMIYFQRVKDLIEQGKIQMQNDNFDKRIYETVIWV